MDINHRQIKSAPPDAPTSSLRWRLAQRLESYWWRRYLRHQSPEVYLRDKRKYWQRALAELEWTPQPGRRVLDAGCGPAGIFILLHEIERVTALDPLLSSYERELAVFSPAEYPDVTFLEQALEHTIKTAPFEVVYCFNAINHVADWELALDTLTASVRPGGKMILTSDVHRHAWLQPVFRALPGDLLHPQQHGVSAYRAALRQRGWQIEREVLLRREAIFDYTGWVCTLK